MLLHALLCYMSLFVPLSECRRDLKSHTAAALYQCLWYDAAITTGLLHGSIAEPLFKKGDCDPSHIGSILHIDSTAHYLHPVLMQDIVYDVEVGRECIMNFTLETRVHVLLQHCK